MALLRSDYDKAHGQILTATLPGGEVIHTGWLVGVNEDSVLSFGPQGPLPAWRLKLLDGKEVDVWPERDVIVPGD